MQKHLSKMALNFSDFKELTKQQSEDVFRQHKVNFKHNRIAYRVNRKTPAGSY